MSRRASQQQKGQDPPPKFLDQSEGEVDSDTESNQPHDLASMPGAPAAIFSADMPQFGSSQAERTYTELEMEDLFRQRMENMSNSSAASSSIISPNVSRHEGVYFATPSATTTQNFQILPTNLTVTSSTIGASMPAVQNNFSSSVSVAAISSRVPVSEYLKTPQSVFDVIKNNTIGSTSTDLYLKFDKLTESLRAAGLHSMIVGTRCEPVITMENPSGYQSETARRETCPLTGRISTVIVEKDDIFKWTYDSERCYHMVIQMFEKSMKYLFTEERLNYNGKAIFEKAKAFLIGHRDKDIEKSRINLETGGSIAIL